MWNEGKIALRAFNRCWVLRLLTLLTPRHLSALGIAGPGPAAAAAALEPHLARLSGCAPHSPHLI